MKIIPIASSSKGNAYLISDGQTTILIECGISYNELKKKSDFIVPSGIDACLVSHSHSDHAKSVKHLLRYGVRVIASQATFDELGIKGHHNAKSVRNKQFVTVGTFEIMFLEMFHDVPCIGFFIRSCVTKERLLFATDTYMIKYAINGLNYIMIEANYDIDLVESDSQRKRLVNSHMSIETAIEYLNSIDLTNIKEIYLLHLSARHSNEMDFKRRVMEATGKPVIICQE